MSGRWHSINLVVFFAPPTSSKVVQSCCLSCLQVQSVRAFPYRWRLVLDSSWFEEETEEGFLFREACGPAPPRSLLAPVDVNQTKQPVVAPQTELRLSSARSFFGHVLFYSHRSKSGETNSHICIFSDLT